MSEIIWRPQPGPQTDLITCPVFEVFFGGARGGGKCLPLDELVLTPFGWKPMGDIAVGDQVANPDGSTSRVIAVYRPGVARIYRLTFSDGASVRCDGGHIWLGHFQGHQIKRAGLRNKFYSTDEIIRKLAADKDARFHVPLTQPVSFQRPRYTKHGDMRPVDPYLLGILLGDGSLTNSCVRYSTMDDEIDQYCAQFGTVRKYGSCDRTITFAGDLKANLERLGVWGYRAEHKFIPDAYLWATVEERFSLLQGLMDTDGYIDDRGQCYFSSSSELLAKQVQSLAWSLGYKATIWRKQTPCLPSYNVYLQGPERERLFRLSRKQARARQPQRGTAQRRLVAIEDAGEAEVGCFQVDNPNGLFITRDFIVTHNTEAMIGDWLLHAATYADAAFGVFVRRSMPELADVIARTKLLFPRLGARYHEQRKEWLMANGARLRFIYLERDSDAEKYQGWNATRVYIEEAGTFPTPAAINKMRAILRSSKGVPVGLRLTGNPGGPGHGWVKARYIDPAPSGYQIIKEQTTVEIDGIEQEISLSRVFIPSKLTDNPALLKSDPTYVVRLMQSGSEQLVKAWLHGDWNVIDGAYFGEFNRDRHILDYRAFAKIMTRDMMIFRGFDWGSSRPFSVGWYALLPQDYQLGDKTLPQGALVKFAEWYGASGPNVGLKMTAEMVAKGIRERDGALRIDYGVADPAIFARDGGPSIAETMAVHGVTWRRADNKRIPGWDQLRNRLVGHNGRPMLYLCDTCVDTIRTLPVLQHGRIDKEDIDTEMEDHCLQGDTRVDTPDGAKRIADLVGTSGMVYTTGGAQALYTSCRMTRRNADVVRVTFADDRQIVCTPDHKFLTTDGWIEAKDLIDKICYDINLENRGGMSCRSRSLVRRFRNLMALDTIYAGIISRIMGKGCIGLSGKEITGIFHPVITYIIKTAIDRITSFKILSLSTVKTIFKGIHQSLIGLEYQEKALGSPDSRLASGIQAIKGLNGINTITKKIARKLLRLHLNQIVFTANQSLTPKLMETFFAQTNAGLRIEDCSASIISSDHALHAEKNSHRINIKNSLHAQKNAAAKSAEMRGVECVKIEPAGKADVYCLVVPGYEAFSANGLIVHNCADETRYALMSRPWVRPVAQPDAIRYPKAPGQMTINDLLKLHTRKQNNQSEVML